MPTITRTPALVAPISPSLFDVAGYDATSEVRTNIHPIVGRADVEATLKPAGLRAGAFTLIFTSKAASFTAAQAHREVGVFHLVDELVPEMSMDYIVTNEVRHYLDPASRREWVLVVGFQEVIV